MFSKLLQQQRQRRSFRGGQRFEDSFQAVGMHLENPPDQFPASGREGYIGDAAIIRARLAADQALFFESVDCGGNGTASQHYLPSDRIDRQRPFMQQDFQHRKIRQAEPGSGNTARVELGEGPVGFHENQPEMDSGSAGGSGLGVAHGVIFTSRYIRRKIFFALPSGDYDSISGLMCTRVTSGSEA
jgi:hypothetical protein